MACPRSQFVTYMYLFYVLGPGAREEENNSRSQGLNKGVHKLGEDTVRPHYSSYFLDWLLAPQRLSEVLIRDPKR